MLTLGEQLILLALDARKGAIYRSQVLQFGLNAAGLADLLDLGHISLRQPDGAFGVTPTAEAAAAPVDDRILEAVMRQVRALPNRDRHPERCIRNWSEPSLHLYLNTLRERGILDWDKPATPKARYGRFRLVDPGPASEARARLDRVLTGTEPTARDRDLAGIAHTLGLQTVVYSGIRGRSKRTALASATQKQRFAVLLTNALPRLADPKITINSSGDLAMARAMIRAVEFDARQNGYDSGGSAGGWDGGVGHHGHH